MCDGYLGDDKQQQTMPKHARVTLRSGPYESSGVVAHRTFRLQGLQGTCPLRTAVRPSSLRNVCFSWCFFGFGVKHCPSIVSAEALRARGHHCVLEETRTRNLVELVVNGEVVFSCDVKQLEFGELGDGNVGLM